VRARGPDQPCPIGLSEAEADFCNNGEMMRDVSASGATSLRYSRARARARAQRRSRLMNAAAFASSPLPRSHLRVAFCSPDELCRAATGIAPHAVANFGGERSPLMPAPSPKYPARRLQAVVYKWKLSVTRDAK